ncbi:thiopeptide-type bacteriocin biosynthesis domain-containing protein [Micromonospora nigra]|uniref:Thiopeptide-type bacteriocin biosynthesis domain-containing protein n=1 Tax=Micromonospora nigra TaxID=145857 RepID=A0A1C6SAG7_9ACTN|nr:lantibiotic dehydratase [Micromonospora nigra]SCL26331.1 thiopeptide-type bacteriocin biosynthesis domain-containing protein [Micromonospora nigra]
MVPAAGAALIRIAAYPKCLVLSPWPDIAGGHPDQWREWLDTTWTLPGFAAAVTGAAPQLADQIQRTLGGEPVPPQRLRRLVQSTVRYLLRWTTRATPFGTFAGVAPVQFGARAAVRLGEAHHAVSRPDGQFIAEHTARAEQDLATLRNVAVVTNSLGYRRGDRWVLPCAHASDDRRWDVEIRLTVPIRAAIQGARSPVRFADLAATVAGPASIADAERLLAELVHTGVLLSALRPPMTATDPAAHVTRHYAIPEPGSRIAVDLRADIAVTLPPPVLHEAERAASTLLAVAPLPTPGWAEYHNAFIERWGPGAAVPIREVLNVLGFPAGYRGSARRAPALFTARDRLLGQLAQQAALDGCAEVVLDDALIDRLRGNDDRPPIPHTELRFTLAADTLHDLDRGAFTLTVLSGSRHAGVAAARFLHLLTPAELAGFQQVYRHLPTALPGAATVQLSGPPLDARLTAVARTPELLPVLPLGDFHPAPPYTIEDLAVTGDGRRLWLVSAATGQPVEPLLFNSVLLPTLQQPLMRFLAEIWTAWTAPCSRFDWGHASGLPFLPRLRRGRTIVHPARWIIDHAALPAPGTTWPQWRDAWQRHRHQRHIPQEVLVGDDDIRLRLDLDDHAHLAVLRDHLDRHPRTVVTEAPGPAGWIDDRPAELLLTLTQPAPAAPPARTARTVTPVQHWPGQSGWLEAHLHGRCDDILAELAGCPAGHLPAGWWFLRYPHPEPHLRLRIPLPDTEGFADTARHLAGWVQHLHDDTLLHDYSLHPYRPETRHGAAATLAAAERVFAADSRAALHRLTGDRQAATAAGMIAIAEGFTGDGPRWLATHVPHRSGPRLDPTQLEHARRPVHDERLAAALAAYRSLVVVDGLDPDEVLGDLLHLHHARMIGVDPASERHCLRLARAVARTILAGRKQ